MVLSAVKFTTYSTRTGRAGENGAQAEASCLEQIAVFSETDPLIYSSLGCGGPREVHDGYTKVEVDVIETFPVSVAQAMQMKCEKLAQCILQINDDNYVTSVLKPLAASFSCK